MAWPLMKKLLKIELSLKWKQIKSGLQIVANECLSNSCSYTALALHVIILYDQNPAGL